MCRRKIDAWVFCRMVKAYLPLLPSEYLQCLPIYMTFICPDSRRCRPLLKIDVVVDDKCQYQSADNIRGL